jgi:hypothetical protein
MLNNDILVYIISCMNYLTVFRISITFPVQKQNITEYDWKKGGLVS